MSERFEGVVFSARKNEVSYKRTRGPLAGAHATVETAGTIDRRLSATRIEAQLVADRQRFGSSVKSRSRRTVAPAIPARAAHASVTPRSTPRSVQGGRWPVPR